MLLAAVDIKLTCGGAGAPQRIATSGPPARAGGEGRLRALWMLIRSVKCVVAGWGLVGAVPGAGGASALLPDEEGI